MPDESTKRFWRDMSLAAALAGLTTAADLSHEWTPADPGNVPDPVGHAAEYAHMLVPTGVASGVYYPHEVAVEAPRQEAFERRTVLTYQWPGGDERT